MLSKQGRKVIFDTTETRKSSEHIQVAIRILESFRAS
jgi:hypothetical protein